MNADKLFNTSIAQSPIVVIEHFKVGPVKIEPNRLLMPYTVIQNGQADTKELIYKYEEQVFDKNNPTDQNLAGMIGAQLALNYGLFCEKITFDGLFDHTYQRFLKDMMENTSREILVNKILQPTVFLKEVAKGIVPQKKKRYTNAEVAFTNTAFPDVHVAEYPKALEGNAKKFKAYHAAKTEELEAIFANYHGKQFHNVTVDLKVALGVPSDEMIRMTSVLKPDLLVIGVPENRHWTNLRFINRPMEIAESVKCPVLLVPMVKTFQSIQQIVYATNFSLEDVGAMLEFRVWMDIFKAKLHCVHICKTTKEQPDAERRMNLLKKILPYDDFKFSVLVGSPEKELEKMLVADKANLVAMLKRHKALWYDTIKPSLTEKIADKTWIPLLIYNQK